MENLWEQITLNQFVDDCQGHRVINEENKEHEVIFKLSNGVGYKLGIEHKQNEIPRTQISVFRGKEESPIRAVLAKYPTARCFDWHHSEYQVFPGKGAAGFSCGKTALDAWKNAAKEMKETKTFKEIVLERYPDAICLYTMVEYDSEQRTDYRIYSSQKHNSKKLGQADDENEAWEKVAKSIERGNL